VTRQLRHIWELSRPWALLTTVGLVASVQMAVSGGSLGWNYYLLSSIGVACAVFWGFAINDFFDRDLDKDVHPERLIPTRRLEAWAVCALAAAALVVSALIFARLGDEAATVGISALIFLFAYTPLKNMYGFLGNITVSLIVALGVVYGVLTGRSSSAVESSFVVLAACAFFALLSREFVKDIEDMAMDRKHGRRKTIPLLRGPAAAFRFSAASLTVALLLLLIFLLMGERYLGLLLALPVLGYGAVVVAKLLNATPDQARPLARLLKFGFIFTLLVLIASYYDRALW
jgi:geranylgeranylglycerol-phosphate geranylgeranyltransferase